MSGHSLLKQLLALMVLSLLTVGRSAGANDMRGWRFEVESASMGPYEYLVCPFGARFDGSIMSVIHEHPDGKIIFINHADKTWYEFSKKDWPHHRRSSGGEPAHHHYHHHHSLDDNHDNLHMRYTRILTGERETRLGFPCTHYYCLHEKGERKFITGDFVSTKAAEITRAMGKTPPEHGWPVLVRNFPDGIPFQTDAEVPALVKKVQAKIRTKIIQRTTEAKAITMKSADFQVPANYKQATSPPGFPMTGGHFGQNPFASQFHVAD